MRYLRFIIAILILTLALALQFWFGSVGVSINFGLAALIVFAFFFDIGEIIALILFCIFVINWEPTLSLDIVLFALLPLAAFTFHHIFKWQRWSAALVAIAASLLIIYAVIVPILFFVHWELLLMDLFGSLVFGSLILLAMERFEW